MPVNSLSVILRGLLLLWLQSIRYHFFLLVIFIPSGSQFGLVQEIGDRSH